MKHPIPTAVTGDLRIAAFSLSAHIGGKRLNTDGTTEHKKDNYQYNSYKKLQPIFLIVLVPQSSNAISLILVNQN